MSGHIKAHTYIRKMYIFYEEIQFRRPSWTPSWISQNAQWCRAGTRWNLKEQSFPFQKIPKHLLYTSMPRRFWYLPDYLVSGSWSSAKLWTCVPECQMHFYYPSGSWESIVKYPLVIANVPDWKRVHQCRVDTKCDISYNEIRNRNVITG